jgi:hypothetical protein
MFAHPLRSLKNRHSHTRTLVLLPIIVLLVFFMLPSKSAQARSATPERPEAHTLLSTGIGAVSYGNTVFTFVVGDDGHLWEDTWNTSSWTWTDLGVSPGDARVGVTNWNSQLYVFIAGYDGHLWMDHWGGFTWTWTDLGVLPHGFRDGAGAASWGNYFYAFLVGSDGHLWVDYWNTSSWGWYDQGTPPNWLLNAGVGTAISGNTVSVFVQSVSDSVWVDYWNGSTWQWTQQGVPPYPGDPIGGVDVCNGGGATVVSGGGVEAFIGDCSGLGHLWMDSWNGSSTYWDDRGKPLTAVSYNSGAGATSAGLNLYSFFVGTDGYLWMDEWNGSSWQWGYLSAP